MNRRRCTETRFAAVARIGRRLMLGLIAIGFIAVGASHVVGEASPEAPRPAMLIEIDGAIGPATSHFISQAIAQAEDADASVLIVQINTPGGLDASTREIVRAMLGSGVPVATYVAPSGARAASAGTYIVYASHVAAMAPGTSLGAATPIQMAPGAAAPADPPAEDDRPAEPSPAEAKLIEDAVAFIRGLAELHGRNAEWAERAVREAATLPYHEALEQEVVEIIADDVPGLLGQADGMSVTVQRQPRTLATAGAPVQRIEPDWRTQVLMVLTNPNIAFILMMLGIYGLIMEFVNPGAIFPGVIGGICLILALFALNLLPLNYAGLALLLLGIALMTAEAFVPSFGILGIGGIVAFALGAMFLFDADVPAFTLDPPVVAVVTVLSAAVFIFVLAMLWQAQRRPVVAGREHLIGAPVHVISWDPGQGRGQVRLHGELWQAESDQSIRPNTTVRVTRAAGLTLHVEPADAPSADASSSEGGRGPTARSTDEQKGHQP